MSDLKCMIFIFIPVRKEEHLAAGMSLIQPSVAVLCPCPSHSEAGVL